MLRPGFSEIRSGRPVRAFVDADAIARVSSVIALSDATDNAVDIFDAEGKQVGQLTGFAEPQGLSSDIAGNLYIADTENSRIQVYAAGLHGAPISLADPGQFPAGVDNFSNGKFVAVTNISSVSGGQGSVSIFKGTKLENTISSPKLQEAFFCAFDARGNLYVNGFDANFAATVGIVAGATSGGTTYQELTTSNVLAFPGQIQITNGGQIAVTDQTTAAIYTYDPPSGGSLGAPVAITPLEGPAGSFAFTKNMRTLFTAGSGGGEKYNYPAGGQPTLSFDVAGEPIGIAVLPTQFPKARTHPLRILQAFDIISR